MASKYRVMEADNDKFELDEDQFAHVVCEATRACIDKKTLEEIADRIRVNVRVQLGGEYIAVGIGGSHVWVKALSDGETPGERVASGDRLVLIS